MEKKVNVFDTLSRSNVSSVWGAVAAEVLWRLGLRHVVVSPGSRSTPLAFAFSRHAGLEAIPVLDERSASFFALGLARQNKEPVALVCTSGTAVANYYPAIIEARVSRIPLLVLTADRPPEMRECSSGQTIDQQKIYGDYCNWYKELSLPSIEPLRLRYLRQTLVHAFERSQLPSPGPVHLNIPFRDPLAPNMEGEIDGILDESILEELVNSVLPLPLVKKAGVNIGKEPSWQALKDAVARKRKGLITVGAVQPENTAEYVAAVAKLSKATGWPVLADALGPLRNFKKEFPLLVTQYDLILRNETLAEELQPEVVFSLGIPPTSKVLRAWLESHSCRTFVIDPGEDNLDPLHRETIHYRMQVEMLVESLKLKGKRNNSWGERWQEIEAKALRLIRSRLRQCGYSFEGKVSWILSRNLPKGTPLFVANSMPVRDMEYFWEPGNRAAQIYFNRGANGIDGTLSSALGMAHGNKKSGVLLTGDLALLHDTNGFLISKCFRGHLTIVLINNRGGGIFETLPVAKFDPPFEDYFATPQTVDFRKLAAAYGIKHLKLKNLDDLPGLVKELPSAGIRIIEIITDRKKDTRWRRKSFSELATRLNPEINLKYG